MQIRSTMERAETAMQELESLGELGTKLLTLRQKLAGPVAQVDEEPEEELGLIDGAAETLGNALAGASKLKSTMEQFKLLMGSGA